MSQCSICHKNLKNIDEYYIKTGQSRFNYCSEICLHKAIKNAEESIRNDH